VLPKEKKEFISEAVKLIEMIRDQKSGKINESFEDEIEKQLSSLKRVAIKAQKKWEKMQEIKESTLNEDDPKKDYGGYYIKDPKNVYALRNLPPTDNPKELRKRQIQMELEKIMKRAPLGWYDQWYWRNVRPGTPIKDSETGKEYVVGTKNELIPDKIGKENDSRELEASEYIASDSSSAVWLTALHMKPKKNNLKIIDKRKFKAINDIYRKIINNPPNFIEDSPISIYNWVERLVKLSKLK
jgi:hypothetical protein